MKTKKTIAVFALLLGISAMGYAYGQLAKMDQVYLNGDMVYQDICNSVKDNASPNSLTVKLSMEKKPAETEKEFVTIIREKIPGSKINFDTLKTINKDATAWLYCPDTVINYPVMKADDYAYYLYHLPDGTRNANGSLFMDYNCASDFSDPLTVIYGHNMKSKKMFGSLTEYKKQKYYDKHPVMYLYTAEKDYQIDLIYGCIIGASQWRERAFMYKENVDALIAFAAHNTTFINDVEYFAGDRVIVMSTCSYEFEDARYVVIGILRGEDHETLLESEGF